VIENILPDAVVCAEAFDNPPDAVLFSEEEAVISRAAEKRRREFHTVRHCARRALRGTQPAPGGGAAQRAPGAAGGTDPSAGPWRWRRIVEFAVSTPNGVQ
jgi:enterobactin synthetase component D / holo-[acyl-carrier protein] synthase